MNETVGPRPENRKRRRDRRGGGGGSRLRVSLLWATGGLLGVAVIGAPLACGAVHRPVLFPLLGVMTALALVTAALATTSQADFRPVRALALPLLFLAIAFVQIIPIPAGLRALFDPAGSQLLALAHLSGARPLSLDPPETYLRFAEAAAALAAGAAALVLASGRRLRFVTPGLVACAGLAALVVGLGHRAVVESKVYGLFPAGRGLPVGPFINPNHTAEFLELAAFAALAFAFARSTLAGQRLWKILAAVLAAGALSALSRGSVLALGAGALTWFLLAPKSDEGEALHRTRFAAALIGLLVVCGIAVGLGAEKLLGALVSAHAGSYSKINVWLDSFKIVRAHPVGIGLGAFGRLYPTYQTVPSLSWHQFVENQPLGILIEAGIPGAFVVLGALALTVRHFFKNARRDRVEASMAAGLVAIVVHNFTDFGLETPGVLLPFCAILGATFGRQAVVPEQPVRSRSTTLVAGIAVAAILTGIVLLRSPSTRDFDALLRAPLPANARDIAHAATIAHPTDHVYALAEARLQPTDLGSAANRLRMLNRAIILCPRCTGAHADAARDLWRLGRHQQALLEWRTAIELSPSALWSAADELIRDKAKPAELTALANRHNRYDLSRHLLARGMTDAARQVLDEGTDQDGVEFHLTESQIALQANDVAKARTASQQAIAVAPRDPRCFAMAAEVEARGGDRDKAVELLTAGLHFEPTSVDLNRKLLALLTETDRWRAIDSALDGFRRALSEAGAPMTEADLAAARVFERRGQFQRALAEYQAAAGLAPDDLGLQLALARAAERAGSVTTAIDAYTALLRRVPDNAESRAALARIQHDKKILEVLGSSPTHAVKDDQ